MILVVWFIGGFLIIVSQWLFSPNTQENIMDYLQYFWFVFIEITSGFDVGEDIKDKIAIHCDVSRKGVIGMPTVSNIYQIPLILEDEGLGSLIVNALNADFDSSI